MDRSHFLPQAHKVANTGKPVCALHLMYHKKENNVLITANPKAYIFKQLRPFLVLVQAKGVCDDEMLGPREANRYYSKPRQKL